MNFAPDPLHGVHFVRSCLSFQVRLFIVQFCLRVVAAPDVTDLQILSPTVGLGPEAPRFVSKVVIFEMHRPDSFV